jgi:triosephosphate isomerase
MAAALGDLQPPVVVVNYKVYPTAIGDNARQLTRSLEEAAESFPEATLAVAPSHPDLAPVAQATELPVLAQHVDGHRPGSGTGRVLPESVRDQGAVGSLLNHAERQIATKDAERSVDRLTDEGLVVITCAEDVEVTQTMAAMEPTYVAMEPPELIGGDVSVTSADPGIIEDSVEAAQEIDPDARVLCGAGVKTARDVAQAIELGTEGVLVASGVTKADDPAQAARDLLEGAVDPQATLGDAEK